MSKKNGKEEILVPIDFTEQSLIALGQSYNLAKEYNAELVLLYVIASIKNWHNDKSASSDHQNLLVQRIRSWLAVLSGSYNVVAKQEKVSSDLKQMLSEELQTPEHNGGLTQRQLHRAVISQAIDVFGPKLQWRDRLSQTLKQAAFPADWPISATLNIPLKAVMGTISWLLKVPLYIPEFLGNFAIKGVAKLFLIQSDLLPAVLDKSFNSLQKNTPTTYAYNQVIHDQLQKIWQTLQSSFPNDSSAVPSSLAGRQSNIQKSELQGLIEYLFEVLDKSKCKTQDKLREFIYEKSMPQQIDRGVEEHFMQATMETVVSIIALAFDTIADKEGYDDLVYSALCTANEVFEKEEDISETKLIEIEQANAKLTDQILDFAIYQALSQKFDFTGERQKLAAASFITNLQKDAADFISKMRAALKKHEQKLSSDFTQAKEPLKEVLELSIEFQRKRAKLQSEADGNLFFHTETIKHLNSLSLEMSKSLTAVSSQLNEMSQLQEEALLQDQVRKELLYTQTILQSLDKQFSGSNIYCQPELALALTKMQSIHSSLAKLSPIARLSPILQPFQRETNLAIDHLHQIEELQKNQLLLMTALLPAPSKLLGRLKQEKWGSLRNAALSSKLIENQLLAQIAALPKSTYSQGLATAVTKMANATMLSEILEAEKDYWQHLTAHIEKNQSAISSLQQQLLFFCQKNISHITSCKQTDQNLISDNIADVQLHKKKAEDELTKLENWAASVKEIPFWNINFFDMNGLIDILKNIAFNRVKEKVSGLVESLYHPHHYNGVLNHLFFIPFIQKK